MKSFCFSISYLWGVKEKGALSKNKQKYLPTQETTISVKMKLWNAKITQTSKQVVDVHIVLSVFNWKNQPYGRPSGLQSGGGGADHGSPSGLWSAKGQNYLGCGPPGVYP